MYFSKYFYISFSFCETYKNVTDESHILSDPWNINAANIAPKLMSFRCKNVCSLGRQHHPQNIRACVRFCFFF